MLQTRSVLLKKENSVQALIFDPIVRAYLVQFTASLKAFLQCQDLGIRRAFVWVLADESRNLKHVLGPYEFAHGDDTIRVAKELYAAAAALEDASWLIEEDEKFACRIAQNIRSRARKALGRRW